MASCVGWGGLAWGLTSRKILTVVSTRLRGNGSWCRRTALSVPGWDRLRNPSPTHHPHTTQPVTCVLGMRERQAQAIPITKRPFVFENDFPALLAETPQHQLDRDGLMIARSESGVCRVLCFSPRHDLTISGMQLPGLRCVVDEWARQFEELGARPDIEYVQIFENHGALMGASNPHRHCQIWACAHAAHQATRRGRRQ